MKYACTNCHKDSIGGGSIVFGGVFFKMCSECMEDEEVIRKMNEYWQLGEEENQINIDN